MFLIWWKLNRTQKKYWKRFKTSCWGTTLSWRIGTEYIQERLKYTNVRSLLPWLSSKCGDSWEILIWFLQIQLLHSSIECITMVWRTISPCLDPKTSNYLTNVMDLEPKLNSLLSMRKKKLQQRISQMTKMKMRKKERMHKRLIQIWKILMTLSKSYCKGNSLKQLQEQLLSDMQVVLTQNLLAL